MIKYTSPLSERSSERSALMDTTAIEITGTTARQGLMRRAPVLTGFTAVGLVLAAHLFHGVVRATKTPVQQVAAFYRTHATGEVIGRMLLVLGAFSYLAFASVVRIAVQRADGARVRRRSGSPARCCSR
jgi:hypothetical protein